MGITFSNRIRHKGSSQIKINVERNGKPYAQLWTFVGRGEYHPWHFKTLSGLYQNFPTLAHAQDFAVHLGG